MAEKGLFFNAMPDEDFETGYDRNYSADDISNWLRVAFTNGVVKTNNEAGTGNPLGLKVVADSGLTIKVNSGFACLVGKPYINDTQLSFTLATAPTGANERYDCVIIRMNNTQIKSERRTYAYVKSLNAIPTASDLTRNDEIYELLLAYVIVNPNATSITQSNIVDERGDETLCPWFTAVKGYENYYDAIVQQFEYNGTIASAGHTITTNLASSLYNAHYSLIEVYCNGLKEENDDYTISTSGSYITITFVAQKSAGAKISVVLNNFIDGEGLSTALAQYSQWVQAVEELQTANEYTYICNGLNDNIQITNIVNAYRNGGTDNGSARIKVVGTFGCKNGTQYVVPFSGGGTSANPYKIFDFVSGNRRVVLDFYDCSEINVPISGVYAWIFNVSGTGIMFKGANIVASGQTSGTCIRAFYTNGGIVVCEDCRIWINAYLDSNIANNGVFKNCRGSVSNVANNSYCFQPSSLIQVIGGEYYAYTGDSTKKSAIVGQSSADTISILYGVNAPVVARSGFYQTNSILQWSGGGQVRCRDMITTLTDVIASGIVQNTIAINKPNTL